MKLYYLKYLGYVLKHKWYVFLECVKTGQFAHACIHDLSKFLPSEFFPYADWFYGPESGDRCKRRFEVAWLHHKNRNKHHWNYWVDVYGIALPMPKKYMQQMIADWRAMGRVFGDTAEEYYAKSRTGLTLHAETKAYLDKALLLDEM